MNPAVMAKKARVSTTNRRSGTGGYLERVEGARKLLELLGLKQGEDEVDEESHRDDADRDVRDFHHTPPVQAAAGCNSECETRVRMSVVRASGGEIAARQVFAHTA